MVGVMASIRRNTAPRPHGNQPIDASREKESQEKLKSMSMSSASVYKVQDRSFFYGVSITYCYICRLATMHL